MTLEFWLLFVVIWGAATLPIGPNVLNCVAISTKRGLRYSLWAIPGIAIAALIHMVIGLTGLATLLTTNAFLFNIVKIAGASYLVYMAFKLWKERTSETKVLKDQNLSRFNILRQAFLISLSNPKAILANIAIFSQFINPAQSLVDQLMILLPTALIIDGLIYGGYCFIGTALTRFLRNPIKQKVFNRVIALLYLVISFGFLTYEPTSPLNKS